MSIGAYLHGVQWENLNNIDVQEQRDYFMEHINHCIERYIPKSLGTNTDSLFKRPKRMDYYCVRKVKKKYHAWKKFTYSYSYRDYQEYRKSHATGGGGQLSHLLTETLFLTKQ